MLLTEENSITSFKDEYRFLSNFYPAFVYYDQLIFESVEHAYVASKTMDRNIRRHVQKMKSPGEVKRFGRVIELRPGWEFVKLGIMYQLVSYKFTFDPLLRTALIDTGDKYLQEGNTWGDSFWGVDSKAGGENNLGKILMDVRHSLQMGIDPYQI